MPDLPTGTVTMLFTDIEGSTHLLQQLGESYSRVLIECQYLLRTSFQQWHGHEVDTQGDSFFVAFARATDALSAERFWQATVRQQIAFKTLAGALTYLRASLHGAILDTLRVYTRPREVPLPEPGEPGEPYGEDQSNSSEVWEFLQTILPGAREQRLAYLLYHCGLKPREVLHFCQQEFNDIQEIYRLRRNIVERVLRHADQLRWRLNRGEQV